jgi:5'(3')-deoxyribonucleotidase
MAVLKKASLEVDKMIKKQSEDLIKKEKCRLNNTYNDIVSTYNFYRDKLINVKDEMDIENIKSDEDMINFKLKYEFIRRQYLFGFVASFFSRLESIV